MAHRMVHPGRLGSTGETIMVQGSLDEFSDCVVKESREWHL